MYGVFTWDDEYEPIFESESLEECENFIGSDSDGYVICKKRKIIVLCVRHPFDEPFEEEVYAYNYVQASDFVELNYDDNIEIIHHLSVEGE